MNIRFALHLAEISAELTAICAEFQQKYGKNYRLAATSPARARTLYDTALGYQAQMARLLDAETTAAPLECKGQWWTRQDMMSLALAAELAQEINHLVAAVAYCQSLSDAEACSYAVRASQRAIAGILHPDVRYIVEELAS